MIIEKAQERKTSGNKGFDITNVIKHKIMYTVSLHLRDNELFNNPYFIVLYKQTESKRR